MNTEYESALNVVREATKVYTAASLAYRSRAIGDVEFLAAKAVYGAAEKVYDAAFMEAQGAKHCNDAWREDSEKECVCIEHPVFGIEVNPSCPFHCDRCEHGTPLDDECQKCIDDTPQTSSAANQEASGYPLF